MPLEIPSSGSRSDAVQNDFHQHNLELIIDYYRKGEKHDSIKNTLGLEVEHFIVEKDTLNPLTYYGTDGKVGAKDILEYLEKFYPEKILSPQGDLLGCAADDGNVTLEPACQLEISVAPYAHIEEIVCAYLRFKDALIPVLNENNLTVKSFGYHPSRKALEMSLIPKERYYYMDKYFEQIGTHGVRMMRGSASTQVSIDYRDEADAVRKIRVGCAIGPILAAISDNAIVFEGEKNTKPIQRLKLWRDVDNARCRIVPGTFAEGFGFKAYAQWLLGISPIFIERENGCGKVETQWVEGSPAQEIYAGQEMTLHDIEHLQSIVWPDVRLKRFVEIRPGDSLPAPLNFGYVALIKGLFYSGRNLDQIERWLGVNNGVWPFDENDVEDYIDAVENDGFEAVLYDHTLEIWIEHLFDLAREGLPESEHYFLEELEKFVIARK